MWLFRQYRPGMTYERFSSLSFDRLDAGVMKIVLDTPGKLNAVTRQMHTDLVEVWRAIDGDSEVRVVIVTGAGDNFSAGGDLEMVEQIASDFTVRAEILKETRDLVYNMLACSKPIVSAVNGVAVGAGLVVALLADISVAGRSARLIDGHTRLGVAAGDHAALMWPLLVGMAKAKYHVLLCEPMTGEEAERHGLVSLCVPDDRVQDEALEVARRLARGSQSALRFTKYAFNNWMRMAGPIFDASAAMEFVGFTGPDVQEGIASIREKRSPRFGGPDG